MVTCSWPWSKPWVTTVNHGWAYGHEDHSWFTVVSHSYHLYEFCYYFTLYIAFCFNSSLPKLQGMLPKGQKLNCYTVSEYGLTTPDLCDFWSGWLVRAPDFWSQGHGFKYHWSLNSSHDFTMLRCIEPFMITLPSSRYGLNYVEGYVKHQIIIMWLSPPFPYCHINL